MRISKCEIRVQHTCLPLLTFETKFYLNYKCGFYSPITLIQSGQTNTHTNKQQSSFNNINVQ